MYTTYKKVNKNPQAYWADYEPSQEEPKTYNKYDISPELETELLNSGYFLKARVMRSARKMRRQQSVVHKHSHPKKHLHLPHGFMPA
jgi:hypothetical protein